MSDDMELYDLRVTVDSIAGRPVCGLAVGDYFEVTERARGCGCRPAGTSASTRSLPCCRCCRPSSGSYPHPTGSSRTAWSPARTPRNGWSCG